MLSTLAAPLRFPSFTSSIGVNNPSTSAVTTSATTLITKYLPGAIHATGNYFRLLVIGPATGTCTLTNTWIGLPATSGNPYNFNGSQVRVTWDGGSSSKTLSPNVLYYSDLISFVIDDTKSVILAFDVASGSSARYASNIGANFVSYYRLATTEAGTTLKTAGYTSVAGFNYIMGNIQVDS
jgi:hypothetical protein